MDLNQGVRGQIFSAEGGVLDFVDEHGNISRAQDVTGILKANAAMRNADTMKGFRLAPDFRKVASIPRAVIDIAMAQGIDLLNDPGAMRQFLNDPDNRAFRTTNERV